MNINVQVHKRPKQQLIANRGCSWRDFYSFLSNEGSKSDSPPSQASSWFHTSGWCAPPPQTPLQIRSFCSSSSPAGLLHLHRKAQHVQRIFLLRLNCQLQLWRIQWETVRGSLAPYLATHIQAGGETPRCSPSDLSMHQSLRQAAGSSSALKKKYSLSLPLRNLMPCDRWESVPSALTMDTPTLVLQTVQQESFVISRCLGNAYAASCFLKEPQHVSYQRWAGQHMALPRRLAVLNPVRPEPR